MSEEEEGELNFVAIICSSEDTDDDSMHREGVWRKADDNRLPPADGHRFNPSAKRAVEVKKSSDRLSQKVKDIMEFDLKENEEGYTNVAKSLVDSYNETNGIKLFGEKNGQI
jgi:hypothetical protein